jgi:hypothetical protein
VEFLLLPAGAPMLVLVLRPGSADNVSTNGDGWLVLTKSSMPADG